MSTETKKSLVPKLRFPEFRGADGWGTESMGNVYSFKGNNSLSRDKLNYVAGSVKNIHYGDIHTKFASHFDITQELVPFINVSELGVVREDNFCEEGDMVFADASEDMADIGKSVEIVRLNGQCLVTGLHTILARRRDERIAFGFGGHLFKSGWIRSQIQKEAQGAKVLGISATRLRNLRLSLPNDKAEQQKIADCLSSLDELIAAQARKVEALKTHKKGLMQQLFPREGETQPRLRFPEFRDAGKWEPKTLADACKMQAGKFVTAADIKEEKTGDLFPCYGGNGLRGFTATHTHDGVFPLIGRQGALCGNVKLASGHFHATEHAVVATPNQGVDVVWLYYLLDLLNLNRFATGQAQPGLSVDVLEKLPVTIPKDECEQKRIAKCLRYLDDFITAAAQELDILKTHKKGLMHQLFPRMESST